METGLSVDGTPRDIVKNNQVESKHSVFIVLKLSVAHVIFVFIN